MYVQKYKAHAGGVDAGAEVARILFWEGRDMGWISAATREERWPTVSPILFVPPGRVWHSTGHYDRYFVCASDPDYGVAVSRRPLSKEKGRCFPLDPGEKGAQNSPEKP